MRVTTYAYPWDLERLGVERTLEEIAADGIDAVDLATTYHPIDSLSPRDGVRVFSEARGAVYFPARSARYGRIKPLLHSRELCAVWPRVAERVGALGLTLNAWTVTLFQPWIRDAHPDCARVFPGGDPSGSGVCPANEDVREYLAALCADMVDQFGMGMVRLEAIIPSAYDLDWLRPRVLVGVSPLARELLALCFCETCTRRGTAAGLDVDRIRRLVNDTITAELAEGRAAPADRGADVAADAELRAFVAQHVEASIELARAAASRCEGADAPKFASTISTPFSLLLGSDEDGLLEKTVGALDHVVMYSGNLDRNRNVAAMAARAEPSRDITMVVTRIRIDQGGTPKATPVSGDQIASHDFQEGVDLGVSELGLYNYALLREADIREFMAGVRRVFS